MIQAYRPQDPAQVVQTIVFLVTPSLAHLLEHGAFLKPAIESIYGGTSLQPTKATGKSPELTIKSVTAVVDALPSGEPNANAGSPPPLASEGLAILMSSAPPEDMSTYPISTTTDEADPVTLEFSSTSTTTTSGHDCVVRRHITLPVANTIFVNGSRATLWEDSWAVTSGSSVQVAHQSRQPLQNFRIDMGCCSPDDFLNHGSVPLQSLTAPRKVVRSMGNVLAQIEVDGKPVPASRELEKAVTEYTTRTLPERAASGPFQVFALVRPPGAVATDGSDADSILAGLWHDAKLYKVTGGGGGWGKKQGLLSLDTAVDFGADEAATVGIPDFETTENLSHEIGAHGMIPRDGTVEFLLYSGDRVSETGSHGSNSSLPAGLAQVSSTSFVLGTAPNPDTQESLDTTGREHLPAVAFYPNHFGMISYGGAALGSDEVAATPRVRAPHFSRTRLDVPDSFFVLRSL